MQPKEISSKSTIEVKPAPLLLRLINYVVDRVIGFTLSLLITILIMTAIFLLNIKPEYIVYMITSLSIYAVTLFLYYFIFELIFGRTFAKFLTKTQVISENGRLTASQILTRCLARMIPFNEFSILRSSRSAWHDSLSNTYVVKSTDLPKEQRLSKRVDRVLTVISVILLLIPASFSVAFPIYENLTGGERIELPNILPTDLKLQNIQKIGHEMADYYTLMYEGNNRSIRITRLIAGYNYEPNKECVYMTPVDTSLLNQNSYRGMLCKEIYIDTNNYLQVYQITASVDELTQPINDIPDYYIKDPPYVLVIRADSGTISSQEVVDMAKGGLKTYTYEELESFTSN